MTQNLKLNVTTSRYLLLASLILLLILAGPSSANSSCIKESCIVEVSASFRALLCGGVIAVLALFWPRPSATNSSDHPVAILRRLGALLLDFTVVLAVLSPLLCIAVLAMEAEVTGTFAWSFSRDFSRPSDLQIMIPGILLMQFLLVLYFYVHNALNRQTVGKHILGYTVTSSEGEQPNYMAATVLSVIGMCMWPISLYLAVRRQDKSFWWDGTSNTKAILLK